MAMESQSLGFTPAVADVVTWTKFFQYSIKSPTLHMGMSQLVNRECIKDNYLYLIDISSFNCSVVLKKESF